MKLLIVGLLAVVVQLCSAGSWQGRVWHEPGDITLGFLIAAHDNNASMTVSYDDRYACGELNTGATLLISQFRMAVKAINDANTCNGVKFGYDVVDSCKLPTHAADLATPWAMAKVMRLYDPTIPAPPAVVIGGYNSRVAAPLAVLLSQFDIPMIDYASTSSDLSDRRRYPLFARTSPSDKHQAIALAVMASKLGNQCVHLVYSEGLYGELGARDIRNQLKKLGICIASDQIAPVLQSATAASSLSTIVTNLQKTATTKTVLCFCEDTTARGLLSAIHNDANKPHFQILASDFWGTSLDLTGVEDAAEGAITVIPSPMGVTGNDPATFLNLAKDITNQDPWLKEFFEGKFSCSFDGTGSKPKCDPSTFTLTAADLPANAFQGGMLAALNYTAKGLCAEVQLGCTEDANNTASCLQSFYASLDGSSTLGFVWLNAEADNVFDQNLDGVANYDFNLYNAKSYVKVASWNSGAGLTTTADYSKVTATTSTCDCKATATETSQSNCIPQ